MCWERSKGGKGLANRKATTIFKKPMHILFSAFCLPFRPIVSVTAIVLPQSFYTEGRVSLSFLSIQLLELELVSPFNRPTSALSSSSSFMVLLDGTFYTPFRCYTQECWHMGCKCWYSISIWIFLLNYTQKRILREVVDQQV